MRRRWRVTHRGSRAREEVARYPRRIELQIYRRNESLLRSRRGGRSTAPPKERKWRRR